MRTLIVGHRGASREAPENTAAAFRLAFEEGADGIEADFRLCADGTILCLHDERTGRTADRDLPVSLTSSEELARLDAGAWKGERFRGERIPSLSEVLGLLPAGKLLFLEIKSGRGIIPPLMEVLHAARRDPGTIRLLSFDSALVRELKEALPSYRAVWVTDYRFRGRWRPTVEEVLQTLSACRGDGVATRARALVDLPFVERVRAGGREIHLWTVDDRREALRLHALGVDSIMTNRPGYLRRVLP